MDKFLREWRQDAVNKHQYETAVFVADKLLALTGMLPRTQMQRRR
jgi:anaphase-promoting complex subunit 6